MRFAPALPWHTRARGNARKGKMFLIILEEVSRHERVSGQQEKFDHENRASGRGGGSSSAHPRAATRIDIPDVRGMPASDARAQLERAGLKLAGAEPAVGTPGQVLWTRPAIGRRVPSDTPVTIVVGVDAGRFVVETIGL